MKIFKTPLLHILFSILISTQVQAAVTVLWDAPTQNVDGTPLTDLSHYLVKLGDSGSNSFGNTNSSNSTTFTFSTLSNGSYKVVVTAVDSSGNESTASNLITFSVVNNGVDLDNDGLNNEEERQLGTDINNADTDGDSINDGLEIAQKTNPRDRRSHLPIHETTICAPWNGYLTDSNGVGMWNVYEHLNTGSNSINVLTEVFNPLGEVQEDFRFALASQRQRDLLIHDFSSRKANSYGNVCSQSSGAAGDLRGTMVYYKPSSTTAGFDFAMAIPATAAKKGIQYLPFNTFNPSLAPQDASNAFTSWAQITNDTNSPQLGVLRYWRSDGVKIADKALRLEAKARLDVALHDVGPNLLGFVEWIPNDPTAKFKIDSARYYHDNPQSVNSFEGAAYLPAFLPSGDILGAPYDTSDSSAILEISNTLDIAEVVNVKAYAEDGSVLFNTDIPLGAKSTYHVILDWYTPGNKGLVTAKGNASNSIIANLMQYKRKSDGGFYYLFANPAVPPLGTDFSSSYNTYIQHKAKVIVANFGDTTESANVNMTRLSGEKIIDNEVHQLVPHSIQVLDLNDREVADQYGVINVTANSHNTLAAWVFRERTLEYNLPLQLTQ